MTTIKFIMVVSIALLSTGLIYHQVVNGLSDKEIEERNEEILNKRGISDEEIERNNKMLDNHIAQLDRTKRQEACSVLNHGLANYSLFDDNKQYSWNQDVDACQRPDGTIILNTTLNYKETK